jgi:hypothetical protein
MILHVLINLLAGSFQRHQQQVITFLLAENRVLKAQLSGDFRLCLTNTDRWRLAVPAHPLGRQCLQEAATFVTPDTLLQWHKRLIVQKFDGSKYRQQLGRPRVAEEAEELVLGRAEEHPTWGYRRIQGALANLGPQSDTMTVRTILRCHHTWSIIITSALRRASTTT